MPDDRDKEMHFRSRFSAKLTRNRQDDIHGMLFTVCMFAAAAECLNTVVTPSYTYLGFAASGTLCNICGAFLAGISSSLERLGPRWSALSGAFRSGFVASFTSFCHTVEHAVILQCTAARRSSSPLYLAGSILAGPVSFAIGRNTTEFMLRILSLGGVASSSSPVAELSDPLLGPWQDVIRNLVDRFPHCSPADVATAVRAAQGHGGKAAAILAEKKQSSEDVTKPATPLPAAWEDRAHNLSKRFPAATWSQVTSSVLAADGHGGKASAVLEEKIRQQSKEPLHKPNDDVLTVANAKGQVEALMHARLLLMMLVGLALAVETERGGAWAALELATGAAMAAAACVAGDLIVVLGEEVLAVIAGDADVMQNSSVNWGTIIANFAALSMLMSSSWTLRPNMWFGMVLVDKFRSAFCGALSAYGAFSEDSAAKLFTREVDVAATNLGMNALLALVFWAIFSYSDCID